ncbi:Fanconi anemia group M protein-like isoform X4 [Melanerpes formicivorus]|uniref:Fanconi anemia group M protein-like isoform X4 n=1 Tax=Melanerpes formicivorus TaxID=211600 RepID=UPI00358ECE8F
MSGGRQRTLPEAWWTAGGKAAEKGRKKAEEKAAEELKEEEIDDDLLLLEAAAAADPSPAAGFCAAAGSIWIYPTNYPLRAYQLRMAHAALMANTLVCLPTGLGKTFVAAVVMYNFYRWFPSGKVLFLAPTKPLVAQQMEACASVMGIPAGHMAEMTGGTQALNRRDLWTAKRVFFLTPQIMVNDLSRGTCPAVEIKCLVVDEAHKALGNHAYCQVVRELSKHTNQFRILALSATPGSDTKAVQQVISNLLIAQIESCAEDSPEIQPYSHERQVEKIVVPLGEDVVDIQNAYIRVLEGFAGRLIKIGVLARRDVPSLTKYQIILARDQYRKNPSSQNLGIHQGVIEGDFALCISLYHGYELLLQMGLRSLFIYLCGIMDGSKGLTRTKNELGRSEDFMKLYQQLTDMFADTSLPSGDGRVHRGKTVFENKKGFIYSHPKLRKLEEIVVEHFKSWNKKCSGQKQSHHHEKWSLSPEEFEMWDRVYRIKEDDGVKEPVLPQSRFETLENLEEMPLQKHQEEACHELSLSEWSIWQNRPFPTSTVDHSDRCYHFISIMEMIELLRHEQGDCSYDLEIQPHLQIEDVHVRRRKSHLSTSSSMMDQKACSSGSRGKPLLPDRDDDGNELFATFKVTKALRRTSGLNGDMPVLHSDTNTSARQLPSVESTDQGRQVDEELEVTFDLNESFDLCDDSESLEIQASEARKGCTVVDEACRSLGTAHTDSGYGSFTGDKSPLSSNLFYLPESYLDSFALVRPSEEPSGLKNTFSLVRRLLAQSPPSLNHLDAFESTLSNEETPRPLQKVICGSSSDRLQDKVLPVASEADASLLLFDHPELRVTSESCASVHACLPEPLSSPEAAAGRAKEEHPWDDSFEGLLDNEEFPETQRKTPNHTPKNNPSKKSFVQEDEDLEFDKQEVMMDEERSVHLFEDEHIPDTNNGSYSTSKKHFTPSHEPYLISRPEAEQESEWLPSEVSCLNADKTCKGQPTSSKPSPMEGSGDTSVTKQLLDNVDLYDCSQELFSVNFELGFSIEECEDEILEENSSNTRKSTSATGSRGGVNSETRLLEDSSRLETSPKWDCRSLERTHISTPLLFQGRDMKDREGAEDASTAVPFLESGGGRKGRGSPEALALALSTPTRGKATKKTPRSIFSSAKEIPEVTFAGVNKSPQRQDCGSSAMVRLESPLGRTESLEDINLHPSCVSPASGPSSESEEEIIFQRKNRRKKNVLKSPDVRKDSDVESPVRATRKRQHPLNMSDMSSDDSSMDFQQSTRRITDTSSAAANKNQLRSTKRQKVKSTFSHRHAARQFLDEEAELSQQDAEVVSSDENEDIESELSSSLAQFLNDEAEVTQVLNECEMKGVYLKSVRSPALGTSYKMVHRAFDSMAIFSQIPEQDQTYAEDSFCVGEEEEEPCPQNESSEEEVHVNFDLLHDETFSGGRKQYLTRRRRRLNQARVEETCSVPLQKKKPSRIIVLSDSSGDETISSSEKPVRPDCLRAEQKNKPPKALPSAASVQHEGTAGDIVAQQSVKDKNELLLGLKASVSEMLDFHPEHHGRRTCSLPAVPEPGKEDLQAPSEVGSSLKSACRNPSVPPPSSSTKTSAVPVPFPPAPLEKPPSLCILADSREISSGAEVISSLKALHGMKVQICSLGSSDYVVSNRLAVERRFLSELLSPANRNKVTQRIQCLQSIFERVCMIVEKDRAKAGETSRIFQRTQYYDGVLAALVQAGVRILFSSCQEESAALLKDLALVEQRKNAAICVPAEVEGHKREMLNFYLTIPNLSYPAALNMCHCFSSIKELTNSSPSEIAAGAQVSAQKAEEIFRYLHYGFDLQMLPDDLSAKGRSNTKS